MSKEKTIQEPFLNLLRVNRVPVSIYLLSGIQLRGYIASFDQHAILLKSDEKSLKRIPTIALKHGAVSVCPEYNIDFLLDEAGRYIGPKGQPKKTRKEK